MPSGPRGRPGANLPVYATAAKSPNPADPSHAYTQSRRRVVRRHGIGPWLAHIWPMLSTCKGFKSPDPATPKPRNTTTFTLPSGILRNTVPQVIHIALLHFQHSLTSAFSQRLDSPPKDVLTTPRPQWRPSMAREGRLDRDNRKHR